MDSKIELLRQKIDLIDAELQVLLKKRWEIALQISQFKEELGLEIYSPDRENEIFLKIMAKLENSSLQPSMLEVYKQILKESRRLALENRKPRMTNSFESSTKR